MEETRNEHARSKNWGLTHLSNGHTRRPAGTSCRRPNYRIRCTQCTHFQSTCRPHRRRLHLRWTSGCNHQGQCDSTVQQSPSCTFGGQYCSRRVHLCGRPNYADRRMNSHMQTLLLAHHFVAFKRCVRFKNTKQFPSKPGQRLHFRKAALIHQLSSQSRTCQLSDSRLVNLPFTAM
jgi:hypothetical protein